MKKYGRLLLSVSLAMVMLLPAALSSAAEVSTGQAGSTTVKTDGQTTFELGLLTGDGSGVNAQYLSKSSTRIQAAIISLRLQGKLDEAIAYTGKNNFVDSNLVGKSNQAILAYLHSHPEYGWNGAGANRFDPLAIISSQAAIQSTPRSFRF
ncbi:hypothetical protein [Paenibacillus wynnii]|uniref:SLH domain-containing protein n=1 Tax=Paenibacillus wynnii TaxID=268407 RepID=A0A098M624_9BACL|nr:hypothetical protein [Paenibacillus wynnii]KGE16997.1 hypothetical protein PWYN_20220 [Paenibacillus wynnii]